MTDLAPLVDSLDANRSGHLSEQQQDEYRRTLAWRSQGLAGRILRTRDAFAKDLRGGRVDIIDGAAPPTGQAPPSPLGSCAPWYAARRFRGNACEWLHAVA